MAKWDYCETRTTPGTVSLAGFMIGLMVMLFVYYLADHMSSLCFSTTELNERKFSRSQGTYFRRGSYFSPSPFFPRLKVLGRDMSGYATNQGVSIKSVVHRAILLRLGCSSARREDTNCTD